MSDGDDDGDMYSVEQRHPHFPGNDLLRAMKDEATATYEALFDKQPHGVGVEAELLDDDVDDPADPRSRVPVGAPEE